MQTKSTIVLTGFLMCATTPGVAQNQTPPEGSAPKDFVLPVRKTISLENGLRATLIPFGNLPKVSIRAVIRMGNLNENADEVSLADLVGDYLEEGTTTRSFLQIAEEAAQMGGDLTIGVGEDQTTISGSVLSESGPAMVALMADVMRNPLLPEVELERLKNDRLRDLAIQKSDPSAMANERFRSVLYPDHPYGRTFPPEAMLAGFTIQQVRNFYAKNTGPERTHIYVAGVFHEEDVESAIRESFGDWEKGGEIQLNIPTPLSTREIHIIDRPGAQQSTVYLGLPTIHPSDSDYRQLLVMNALLGGSFMSRITSNIREDKGYTYSPSSSVSVRYRDAYWQQFASITTNVTGPALREIFYEIDRLRKEPPGAGELEGIQNYLAGIFVLQNSSQSGIINLLSFSDLHGLPDTYLTEYVRTIHSVTPEDVQQLAVKYIRPEEMLIVIAGDRKTVEGQIKEFGRIAKD